MGYLEENYFMKKVLLAICLLPNVLFAQKMERYCELLATGRMLSTKVTIAVDFGEERAFFKDTRMRDDEGKLVKFNSLIDALNYMGSQNWKLVNAFPIATGNQNVLHFYFKQEYDASELAVDPKAEPKK